MDEWELARIRRAIREMKEFIRKEPEAHGEITMIVDGEVYVIPAKNEHLLWEEQHE